MPLLEVIKVSRQRMLVMWGDVGDKVFFKKNEEQQAIWKVLEASLKECPTLTLLSSTELRKERSQTRILKVRLEVIRRLVRFITSENVKRLKALQD
jgi:hypothetical protein